MANSIPNVAPPTNIERLGFLITYIATLKDVPGVFRSLGLPSLIPSAVKNFFLDLYGYPDFYISFFYTIILCFVWDIFSNQRKIRLLPEETSNMVKSIFQNDEELAKNKTPGEMLKLLRFRGYARTFFLSYLKEKLINILLDPIGVEIYDGFNWPEQWGEKPEGILRRIIRLSLKDSSIEYRMRSDHTKLDIRIQDSGSEFFGPPISRRANYKDARALIVDSWASRIWFLGHVFKRCGMKGSE